MQLFFAEKPTPLAKYVLSGRRVLKTALRSRWETGRSVTELDFVSFIQRLRSDVLNGLNFAYFQLSGVDIYDGWRKREIKRELGGRTRLRASLYGCESVRSHYEKSIGTLF